MDTKELKIKYTEAELLRIEKALSRKPYKGFSAAVKARISPRGYMTVPPKTYDNLASED